MYKTRPFDNNSGVGAGLARILAVVQELCAEPALYLAVITRNYRQNPSIGDVIFDNNSGVGRVNYNSSFLP